MCSQPEGALVGRIAIYNLCKLGLQKEVKGVRDPAGSRGVWWEETEADPQPGGGLGEAGGGSQGPGLGALLPEVLCLPSAQRDL